MIKFVGEIGGRPAVGLGLSHENLSRLKGSETEECQPIHIHLAEMGLPYDLTIFIFAGETEESMTEMLKEAGVLHAGVPIKTFKEQ